MKSDKYVTFEVSERKVWIFLIIIVVLILISKFTVKHSEPQNQKDELTVEDILVSSPNFVTKRFGDLSESEKKKYLESISVGKDNVTLSSKHPLYDAVCNGVMSVKVGELCEEERRSFEK